MLTQSYANTNSIWHSAHVCDLYANVQKCSCVLFRFLSYLNVYYFICVVFSLCGLLSSQRWSILACFDEEHVEVKPQKYTEWTNELPRTETYSEKGRLEEDDIWKIKKLHYGQKYMETQTSHKSYLKSSGIHLLQLLFLQHFEVFCLGLFKGLLSKI